MTVYVIEVGEVAVEVDPELGGRIGQITVAGTPLLLGREHADASGLTWGAYPMVPWAGRIRDGRFEFRGRSIQLPRRHGAHAMHGVGFVSEWQVDELTSERIGLSLRMPADQRWPFGGVAEQTFTVAGDRVTLDMRVSADEEAFPASFGWHPWFRKPDRLEFRPDAMYRRDDAGIAVDELVEVPPGPWDDCFVNHNPVRLTIGPIEVSVASDATDWVVYDEPAHATCVEPQSGPPDALNLTPTLVEPAAPVSLTATIGFRPAQPSGNSLKSRNLEW